ncbi:MAG TPA: phage tail protein [Planctomycetaceae bacterium]|nr:phage tail protein [Planctomycetaceae bacterium]
MMGEIRMFAGNYAPRGWQLCEGQMLNISQNSALFSILGTTYGGDGRTTFALPDLRGRAPLQPGVPPGLQPLRLGEKGGSPISNLRKVPSQAAPVEKGQEGIQVPDVSSGVEVRPPYIGINYIIAIQGIYPSRS